MIFLVFMFLTVLIISFFTCGVFFRRPGLLLVASVLMILVGGIVLSEGIRDESSPILSKSGDVVRVTGFSVLVPDSDMGVAIIANLYFFGGWALLVFSLAFGVYISYHRRRAKWYYRGF